jgi:hypothetical protein
VNGRNDASTTKAKATSSMRVVEKERILAAPQ